MKGVPYDKVKFNGLTVLSKVASSTENFQENITSLSSDWYEKNSARFLDGQVPSPTPRLLLDSKGGK